MKSFHSTKLHSLHTHSVFDNILPINQAVSCKGGCRWQRKFSAKDALVDFAGCMHSLMSCYAFRRYGGHAVGPVRTLPVMRSFTFLRLIPDMMSPEYQTIWFRFMDQMQQIQNSE